MKRIAPLCLAVLTLLILGCGNSDNFVFTNTNGVVGVPGVATQLAFVQNPAQTTNTDFSTPPIVEVQDAFGNRVPGATNTITVSLVNPGTAVLNGTTTRDAVDGQAVFTGLSVSEPGTFTLTCSAAGLTGASSATFTVTDGVVPQGLVLYSLATPRGNMGFNPSQVIQLDPTTGEYIGTLGFLEAGALTEEFVDLECLPDGTVYSLNFGGGTSHLIQVNMSDPSNSTDLGTITGMDVVYALAYDANNGIMYAVGDTLGAFDVTVCTLNLATRVATPLPNDLEMTIMGSLQGLGLAYDDSTNTLYLSNADDLYTVDTSTGNPTLVGAGGTVEIAAGGGSQGIRGMDVNPSTNALFAVGRGGAIPLSGAGSRAGTINKADGVSTQTGLSPQCNGLSFCENPTVGVASPPRQTGYTVESITQAFEDISGTGSALGLNEDDQSTEAIGFTFNFNGTDYTNIVVDSNGILSFVGTDINATPRLLPADNVSNDSLMPWWDDLDPTSGAFQDIYVQTLGTMPNRRFVVQYDDIRLRSGTIMGTVTFEVVLYETTNVVEFHYADVSSLMTVDQDFSGGRSAVVGIQTDSTHADLWSAFQNVITDTTAIRFTPAP